MKILVRYADEYILAPIIYDFYGKEDKFKGAWEIYCEDRWPDECPYYSDFKENCDIICYMTDDSEIAQY